jgi:hypothetical protein
MHLKFNTGLPPVEPGKMRGFVVMTRNKEGGEYVFAADYLNAYPLETEDLCGTEDCKAGKHEDNGCPHTGWHYDQSNYEYDHCWYAIQAEVIAWAEFPSVAEVKAAISTPVE